MSLAAYCLAQAIYFEARSEPLAAQLMVANVVINRVESKRYPKTICEVVYQKDQFSFVTLTDLVPRDKQAWQQAQYWADKYLQNKLDYTGACHYHADYVEPYWSKTMKGYKAGTHIFYEGGC